MTVRQRVIALPPVNDGVTVRRSQGEAEKVPYKTIANKIASEPRERVSD